MESIKDRLMKSNQHRILPKIKRAEMKTYRDIMILKTKGRAELKFLWVPAGEFMMGSPSTEKGRSDNEEQTHRVMNGFWMSETVCTNEFYNAVMGEESDGDQLPKTNINWNQVKVFIEKLNSISKEGITFRLPTEVEWEYACRAGTKTAYSFGDEISADQANFGSTKNGPVAVKSYPPNPWGFYEMHGNVWEWCEDEYIDYSEVKSTYYPTGNRVLRGGSWIDDGRLARSAQRDQSTPDARDEDVGFRLVADGKPSDEGNRIITNLAKAEASPGDPYGEYLFIKEQVDKEKSEDLMKAIRDVTKRYTNKDW